MGTDIQEAQKSHLTQTFEKVFNRECSRISKCSALLDSECSTASFRNVSLGFENDQDFANCVSFLLPITLFLWF